MISGLGSRQLYLYVEPTDMRKSFNGLSGLIRNELHKDPGVGDAFIFVNKRRDRIKILVWDFNGYLIYYKQLESGTFEIPVHKKGDRSLQIERSELVMIMEGIQLKNVRHRKRYRSPVLG